MFAPFFCFFLKQKNMLGFQTLVKVNSGSTHDAVTQKVAATGYITFHDVDGIGIKTLVSRLRPGGTNTASSAVWVMAPTSEVRRPSTLFINCEDIRLRRARRPCGPLQFF